MNDHDYIIFVVDKSGQKQTDVLFHQIIQNWQSYSVKRNKKLYEIVFKNKLLKFLYLILFFIFGIQFCQILLHNECPHRNAGIRYGLESLDQLLGQ